MHYKTAECVSPGHPDKLCDQISDRVLDECLAGDPESRVAIETMGWHGKVFISGELTTNSSIDYEAIVRAVLRENRYDPDGYEIVVNVAKQSNEIAQGVDTGGAWDQGIMVWYATRETDTLIPYELQESRAVLQWLWDAFPETRDAKSQITTHDGALDTIVVSAERLDNAKIKNFLHERYADVEGFDSVKLLINPAWPWDNGGFESDAWVTGRKLAVDNYGPQIEIWGWAFSWKDATKVDRSAAYIARKIAVDHLKNNPSTQRAKTKLAYAIGYQYPVMISIETDQWEYTYDGPQITPAYIIETLDLKKPRYAQTAKRWHFWNGFIWDK